MKKFTKIALLWVSTVLLSLTMNAQVTIGTGTATGHSLPVDPYWGYTYSQVIYHSWEIGASGDITTLSWYFAGSSLSNSNDWTIYIGHTTKTVFTSTSDWVPVGSMTQVFSGTFADPGAAGWIQFDITDFTYNGTDNLVIAVDENASGYNSDSDEFYSTSVTGNRGLKYTSDGTNPDPASPPTGGLKSYIANIILGGITASCPNPTNQTEANITTSGADLGWTDASGTHWDLYIVASGSPAPTAGSTPTVNDTQTNPYTWSGGNTNTAYDWYVRSDCGQDDIDVSAWVGPGTFTTLCAPITTFPALEDFETFTVSAYATGYENCWSTDPSGYNTRYRWNVDEGGTPSSNTGPEVDHTSGTSTGNYLFVEASSTSITNEAYVYSPEYDLTSLTSPQIDFWYHMYGASMGELHLDIDAGSGWVNDIMPALIGEQQSAQGDDWLQSVVSLNAYAGQTVKFRFRGKRGTSYQGDMAIDDVTVGEAPTCPDPSAQTESSITNNSASLGWTENGSATSWDIELGANGFTPTGTPTQSGVTNPYTYGGLSAYTTYDWYVRADCGGGDYSSWVGPSTFTTACVANTSFPWSDDFEGTFLPMCWSKIVTAGNDITKESYQNHTPAGAYSARFSSFSNSADYNQYLFTGQHTINSNYTQLSFWHRKFGTHNELLEWGIATTTDPNDYAWTAVTLSNTDWQQTTVDLSAYIGQTVYIGFHYYGDYLYYVYLDDVSIAPADATWTGTAKSNDWHDANNWDTGVPGISTNVTIPAGLTTYPTIGASAVCNNISFGSTASGDASLLDNEYLTIYGDLNVERYLTANKYHGVSPSVDGEVAGLFHLGGATGLDVYLYSNNEATYDYTEIVDVNTSLNTFEGYMVWLDGANATPPIGSWTFTEEGTFNTGSFGATDNVTMSAPGGIQRGWNFFGNPYTSALDWDATSGWTKTTIDATVYVYNYPQWATYSFGGGGSNGGSQHIAMGQGFFVHKTDLGGGYPETGTLTMDNDVRVHNNVGYLKSEIANKVSLQVAGIEFSDEASIIFREDATAGFDSQFDAYKLQSPEDNAPTFYSVATENLAVNVLPPVNWVQLGFHAGVSGEYTISAMELNDIPSVVLEDTFTGEFTDLTSDSYTFIYSTDDKVNRFIVHFTPLSTPENAADLYNIYSYDKDVYVAVPENTNGHILVYDMIGQEVAEAPINSVLNVISLEKSAYYIVKVMSDENVVTRKVFIK